MYANCPNCAKSLKTANGAAFHASWCKPAEPIAEPRDFTFQPGEFQRFSAVAETADDAAAKIGAAFGPLPAHALAYVAPLGPSCLNVGPETARILFPQAFCEHAHRAPFSCSCADCGAGDVFPPYSAAPVEPEDPRLVALAAAERLADVAKARKAPAKAAPKGPKAGAGKHARCVLHVPMTRTAPGIAVACFDAEPGSVDAKSGLITDTIEERRAFVEAIDASWNAHHAAELARRESYGPAREHAPMAPAFTSRLMSGAELAKARERIAADVATHNARHGYKPSNAVAYSVAA